MFLVACKQIMSIFTDPSNVNLDGSSPYMFGFNSRVYSSGFNVLGNRTSKPDGFAVVVGDVDSSAVGLCAPLQDEPDDQKL